MRDCALVSRFLATALGAALLLQATPCAETITYRASLTFHIDTIVPAKSAHETSEQFFPGRYGDEAVHKRVQELLKLRGQTARVSGELVQRTDGEHFRVQILGVKLPDKSKEIRNIASSQEGVLSWFTYDDETVHVGTLDSEWTDEVLWAPIVSSLLQYLPTGKPAALKPNGPRAETYIEAAPLLDSRDQASLVSEEKNYTVEYVDSARRSIRSIACYWNRRRTSPYCLMTFKGSSVTGKRHRFDEMELVLFDADRVSAIHTLEPSSHYNDGKELLIDVPAGQNFTDRRFEGIPRYTFAYDGRSFPSEEKVKGMFGGTASSVGKQNTALYQFVAGGLLIAIGLGLWLKSKRLA